MVGKCWYTSWRTKVLTNICFVIIAYKFFQILSKKEMVFNKATNFFILSLLLLHILTWIYSYSSTNFGKSVRKFFTKNTTFEIGPCQTRCETLNLWSRFVSGLVKILSCTFLHFLWKEFCLWVWMTSWITVLSFSSYEKGTVYNFFLYKDLQIETKDDKHFKNILNRKIWLHLREYWLYLTDINIKPNIVLQ